MAKSGDTGEIVKRALSYPYPKPARSFVQVGQRTLDLPPEGPDLSGRTPLLAYGSNAAPVALARKLADAPDVPLPVLRAELHDFDVIYSAHISPSGSVPATLRRSAGTRASVHVAFPDDRQLPLLSATEPNYELTRLVDVSCRLESGGAVLDVHAFLSRHGCLLVDGLEVALRAVPARGREFSEMTQHQVLELVRSRVAAEQTLERFILRCAANGGLAPLPVLDRAIEGDSLLSSSNPQTAEKRRSARRAIRP